MPLHERETVRDSLLDSVFASHDIGSGIPKYRMPAKGMQPKEAYQITHDELMLDGNSRQNLATFCQTWEEPEVHALMDLCIDKNMIDKDEYPQTAEIERRCVHMLADLWNAPEAANPVGASAIGSSEACMLAGMAAKWRWRAKTRGRRAAHRQAEHGLRAGAGGLAQVREVLGHRDARGRRCRRGTTAWTSSEMLERVDENTILVVPTFGVTYTGAYELGEAAVGRPRPASRPIPGSTSISTSTAPAARFSPHSARRTSNGTSGCPRVKSISTSGHKFGLAPLGVGWVVWRDAAELPDDLIFHVTYLGGDMPVFQINFSRPAGQIVAQYYDFLRLGREGYSRVHSAAYATGRLSGRRDRRSSGRSSWCATATR